MAPYIGKSSRCFWVFKVAQIANILVKIHFGPNFDDFAPIQIESKIKNSLIYQKNRLFPTLLQLWRLICDLAKLVTGRHLGASLPQGDFFLFHSLNLDYSIRNHSYRKRGNRFWSLPHRVNGVTLPLRNATKKRVVFSNTILCSSKDLGSSFSKNVWPFE